jgi:hypothetical protein
MAGGKTPTFPTRTTSVISESSFPKLAKTSLSNADSNSNSISNATTTTTTTTTTNAKDVKVTDEEENEDMVLTQPLPSVPEAVSSAPITNATVATEKANEDDDDTILPSNSTLPSSSPLQSPLSSNSQVASSLVQNMKSLKRKNSGTRGTPIKERLQQKQHSSSSPPSVAAFDHIPNDANNADNANDANAATNAFTSANNSAGPSTPASSIVSELVKRSQQSAHSPSISATKSPKRQRKSSGKLNTSPRSQQKRPRVSFGGESLVTALDDENDDENDERARQELMSATSTSMTSPRKFGISTGVRMIIFLFITDD